MNSLSAAATATPTDAFTALANRFRAANTNLQHSAGANMREATGRIQALMSEHALSDDREESALKSVRRTVRGASGVFAMFDFDRLTESVSEVLRGKMPALVSGASVSVRRVAGSPTQPATAAGTSARGAESTDLNTAPLPTLSAAQPSRSHARR